MSLNDKLSRLRDLLHSIEEEDGDAYNVALDMVGEHIERGTGAGMVIAREWLECGAYTVWLDSGYVTAVKLESQRGGIKPALPFARIWCPVRHTMITANLYEHPAHAASTYDYTYAFCESGTSYDRWASSLSGAPFSAHPQDLLDLLRASGFDVVADAEGRMVCTPSIAPGGAGAIWQTAPDPYVPTGGYELRGVQIPEGDLYQAPSAAAFAQVLGGYRRRQEAAIAAQAQATVAVEMVNDHGVEPMALREYVEELRRARRPEWTLEVGEDGRLTIRESQRASLDPLE